MPMIFKNVNITRKLEKEEFLLEEAKDILENSKAHDEKILHSINDGNDLEIGSDSFFILSKAEASKVFSIETIRNICIKYRLRFLNTKYFKGEFPYEAVIKIKETEKKYKVRLTTFYIIAPSEKFHLKDSKKDPLLFASIGNRKYFLVHQWGNDLKWYRKLLYYPFRDMGTLACSAVIFSFFITLFLPKEIFAHETLSKLPLLFLYHVFFFFIFSSFIFLVSIIYGIAALKDFSRNVWDSEYFN